MSSLLRLARLWLALPALLVAACTQEAPATGPTVLAAASLQEALEEAADDWTAQGHPRPVLSFAATSALARQVEAGAPADLLISADQEWMDRLTEQGLIRSDSRRNLAGNRLVLVAPASTPTTLTLAPGVDLDPLLGSNGRLAIAEPDSVPAGRYGKVALAALGAWSQVEGRLAIAENVRAALALVARGEAPLGVVYITDAQAESGVQVAGVFPEGSHPPIVYPMAVLANSTNPQAAGFAAYLAAAQGQAILSRYGFAPAEAR